MAIPKIAPEKAVSLADLSLRLDSFMNSLTGIGTSSRDKRSAGTPFVNELTRDDCEFLYRGNDVAAVIIENVPDEKWRKGFDVCIEDDEEQSEEIEHWLEEQGFAAAMHEAEIRARQFGGGAVLVGARDGVTDLRKPLAEDRIQSIDYLTVLDRWELRPATYYGNPMAPKYGQPELFYLQPLYVGADTPAAATNMLVHESRLIMFDGVPVTRRQRIKNSGWGDPVLVRCFEALRDFNLTWGGVGNLMSDFAQGVAKLQGLNEMIVGAGDDVAAKRAAVFDMMRSVARMILLDAGDGERPAEEFKREVASLTSVPETLQQFALRVAGAARMPVSLLMGQAPAGLNATGDSDIRWYYDRISSAQEKELKPRVCRFLKLAFKCKTGPTRGQEPENWSIRFHPLWQLDAVQEADRRLKVAQADVAMVGAGIISPEEVAISRFGGDQYNPETTIDKEAHQAMADARAAGDLKQPELKQEIGGDQDEMALKKAQLAAKGGGTAGNAGGTGTDNDPSGKGGK